MLEFDHSTTVGTTLYKEVKRRLLRALAGGQWKPGEAIPAEKKLCELFSVSIGTLRKAIDELVAESILIRHQGRGTFVSMHNREQQMFRFFNVVNHDGTKNYPQLELIAFARKKAGMLAAQKLRHSGTKVYEFTNVLSLQGTPVIVDDITVPDLLFMGLTEALLHNRPNTLYSLYQVRFGISIIRIEEHLRAVSANAHYADLLQVTIDAPLLEVRRVAYSYDDQPVEWRISHINTEKHEYMAQATHNY